MGRKVCVVTRAKQVENMALRRRPSRSLLQRRASNKWRNTRRLRQEHEWPCVHSSNPDVEIFLLLLRALYFSVPTHSKHYWKHKYYFIKSSGMHDNSINKMRKNILDRSDVYSLTKIRLKFSQWIRMYSNRAIKTLKNCTHNKR